MKFVIIVFAIRMLITMLFEKNKNSNECKDEIDNNHPAAINLR